MKKVLIVFGTRPEAIKMAPIIKELQHNSNIFDVKVCVTGQHREMLDQVLETFEIETDYDLNIMRTAQSLSGISIEILKSMETIFEKYEPEVVLLQGDTSTTFITALASFYYSNPMKRKIVIAHIEAGLRTNDIYSPWPEEANRKLTSILTDIHFAPTIVAKENLLAEGINENSILVSGNSVIDALYFVLSKIRNSLSLERRILKKLSPLYNIDKNKKFILVTGHRRENIGKSLENICFALQKIAINNPDIDIVFPLHPNPLLSESVNGILKQQSNIYIIEPLDYISFIYLMSKAHFIISDSGGIQEEAPSIGKHVLVTREKTERKEVLESGLIKLVGSSVNLIIQESQNLLDKEVLESEKSTIYGTGDTSKKIVSFLKDFS